MFEKFSNIYSARDRETEASYSGKPNRKVLFLDQSTLSMEMIMTGEMNVVCGAKHITLVQGLVNPYTNVFGVMRPILH